MASEIAYKPSEKLKKIYSGGTLTPPKFMPSYYEYLSTRGVQIIINSQLGSSGTIYDIPPDKILYITSINAVAYSTAVPSVAGGVYILDDTTQQHLINLNWRAETGKDSVAVSYLIPLKFLGNDKIYASLGANNGLKVCFTGFLIHNRDIPTF